MPRTIKPITPEQQLLLNQVKKTSDKGKEAFSLVQDIAIKRRAAIQIAMNAGIPTTLIAQAAGTKISNIYRIVRTNNK